MANSSRRWISNAQQPEGEACDGKLQLAKDIVKNVDVYPGDQVSLSLDLKKAQNSPLLRKGAMSIPKLLRVLATRETTPPRTSPRPVRTESSAEFTSLTRPPTAGRERRVTSTGAMRAFTSAETVDKRVETSSAVLSRLIFCQRDDHPKLLWTTYATTPMSRSRLEETMWRADFAVSNASLTVVSAAVTSPSVESPESGPAFFYRAKSAQERLGGKIGNWRCHYQV